jgi:hypothetical protein
MITNAENKMASKRVKAAELINAGTRFGNNIFFPLILGSIGMSVEISSATSPLFLGCFVEQLR